MSNQAQPLQGAHTQHGQADSVELLLTQLQAEGAPPQPPDLAVLSDLSLPDLQRVREAWTTIGDAKRLHIVKSLVEESVDNLHLQLGRLLRLALSDPLPEVRILAVRGLWEDREADLVGPLIQMLNNDPYDTVRAAAAEALGAFVLAGELDELSPSLAMRAEDALLAVLHAEMEPLIVQAYALESIAFSGETGVRELLEDSYYSRYKEMRVAALRAMGRSADVRWRSTVQSELESSEAEMRAAAARACGQLEARDALESLIELLDDESKPVRLAAIFALGRLGGRQARELLGAISSSDDPDEANSAANALEEALFYGDAEGIPLFDETAENWEDEADDLEEW
ncbi:MAG: HEAT repeat domain-containing protein [Caldilineaceae bacterium]|nr:HEAT repeat domain-containing protein [Caldilineaceae bacterium]MDE0429699.1 HEAT repeat domain-containing protein [Caldilineaceae bacterium]